MTLFMLPLDVYEITRVNSIMSQYAISKYSNTLRIQGWWDHCGETIDQDNMNLSPVWLRGVGLRFVHAPSQADGRGSLR